MTEWMGQYLYERGYRLRAVSAHPALNAYRARSPRWRMQRRDHTLGTSSKHAWMHEQSLDPRRLGVISFEYVAPVTPSSGRSAAPAQGPPSP
jgi:hypothetical protein